MSQTQNSKGFNALNLTPGLLRKLDQLGFVTPTPIQRDAIPFAMEGRDVIGIAQTGTGKTLAFGLPMAANLQPQEIGLVIAPTRELAQQIEETFHKLGIRTALLIGGASMGRQLSQLRARPTVIVATPGRLIDHLDQRSLELKRASIVVLDEADRMLDMGFAPAIKRILNQTPRSRQTMLFSATMPKEIAELAAQYLNDPKRIEIERPGTAAELVEQELRVVSQSDKQAELDSLLKEHKGTVLVFARTRYGAKKLARNVRTMGHTAAELHSDRTLAQRTAALHGFKTGAYRVLVATDIAARGIDVKEIALVVNYDVPANPEDYVHRIGRTGRAGSTGRAVTLATPEQHGDIRDIEKLLKAPLPRSKQVESLEPARAPRRTTPTASRPGQRNRFRPNGSSRRRWR